MQVLKSALFILSLIHIFTDYLRDITTVEPAHLKASGRGEYVPVADNTTQEGRSRNRRVIIKIYNSYSSDFN